MPEKKKSPLEIISEGIHDAWTEWTKHIQRRVKPVWRDRWEKLWVDYDELPADEKEKDRVFARKIQRDLKKKASFARQLGFALAKRAVEEGEKKA